MTVSPSPQGRAALAAALLLLAGAARATDLTLFAVLEDRAVFLVNGTPRVVPVGDATEAFRLISLTPDTAVIEAGGERRTLKLGEGYVATATNPDSTGGRLILSPDEQGHYFADVTVNGYRQRGIVDTGATHLSVTRRTADAMHIPYAKGEQGQTQTANGIIRAWKVKVPQVQVGTVTLYDVETVVRDTPEAQGVVLIGTSLLNRFQMTRDQSMLVLTKKAY